MSKSDPITHARLRLATLRVRVSDGAIPKARREWGGANVVISTHGHGSHYREVVTPHALEVSWMFERLRDAFTRLVDGCTKFELYGRLEIAVNAAIDASPNIDPAAICAVLLDEADAILDEMSEGRFEYLAVALSVAVARDYAEA
jgi:hypothetical protein